MCWTMSSTRVEQNLNPWLYLLKCACAQNFCVVVFFSFYFVFCCCCCSSQEVADKETLPCVIKYYANFVQRAWCFKVRDIFILSSLRLFKSAENFPAKSWDNIDENCIMKLKRIKKVCTLGPLIDSKYYCLGSFHLFFTFSLCTRFRTLLQTVAHDNVKKTWKGPKISNN